MRLLEFYEGGDLRAFDMLAPTLNGECGVVHPLLLSRVVGRLAILPLRPLDDDEIADACLLHAGLERGLLVVV